MRQTLSQRSQNGSILFMTIFVLLILALIATGFMALLPVEMRSARHDRAVIQGSFATDAAIQMAMNQLGSSGGNPNAVALKENGRVYVGNGWSFEIDNVVDLGGFEFRVTANALDANGRLQRQAVAIIDNSALLGALNNLHSRPDGTQSTTGNFSGWPANIPIVGDVYFQGVWHVDNSMALSGDPAIKGLVHHKGEDDKAKGVYTKSISTAEEFAEIYKQGLDAVQPFPEVGEGFTQEGRRTEMLTAVFGVPTLNNAQTLANQINQTVTVPKSGNQMNGGVYIKHPNGNANQSKLDIRLYLDTAGNSVVWVGESGKKGGGNADSYEIVFVTKDASGQDLPTDQQGILVRDVTSNGTPPALTRDANNAFVSDSVTGLPTGQITTSTTPVVKNTQPMVYGDLSKDVPIYVEGNVVSLEGVISGKKTLGTTAGLNFTGEILKSDVVRGEEATTHSLGALGLVADLNPPNNSSGMSMTLENPPNDNIFNIYAHLMALPSAQGNSGSTWMFNSPSHSSTAGGAKFRLFGTIFMGENTPGHLQQAFDFMSQHAHSINVDPNVPSEMFRSGGFIPQLRSYVEIPIGE